MHGQAAIKRVFVALRLGWRLKSRRAGVPPGVHLRGSARSLRAVSVPNREWAPPFPSAQADGRPQARQGRFQSLAAL